MSGPTTTLMPFAQLPSCAQQCGDLFDANGACVPPAAAQADETTYEKCFCNFGALQPWKSGPTGVCEYVACDAAGFSSIQGWFTSMCNAVNGGVQTSSSSSATSTSGSSRGSSGNSGNGGDWLSNHWRWVVMLVILVVAITGIWIGACIWRRRYLQRKDRMYELGKHAHKGPSGIIAGSGVNVNNAGLTNGLGSFMPGPPVGVYEEKPKEKKKWTVTQRT